MFMSVFNRAFTNLYMKESGDIDELIVKYLKGTLSVADSRILEDWIGKSEHNRKLFDQLTDNKWISGELRKVYEPDVEESWAKIVAYNQNESLVTKEISPAPLRRIWRTYAIAASVILAIITGGYTFFYLSDKTQVKVQEESNAFKNIQAPEKSRATITLSNGNVIYLDSMINGTLAEQTGAEVVKQAESELVYKADSDTSQLVFNSLFNPRGSRIIKVTLSDGTRVWLNNETTLRYPVNFTGNDRRVEIIGEAYFEVAKMAAKPFIVVSGTMNIEVLGTHFNINAYTDEDFIRTTLLEGKIKVSDRSHSLEILPGQQVNYAANSSDRFRIDRDVDLESVIAWKQGMFQFDQAELPVIMRQISRWYDMDIVYDGIPANETFGGGIGKQVPLSNVLQMLEGYGIEFSLQNGKIVVKP